MIHDTGLVALQEHSRATVTFSVPAPPAAPKEAADDETVASQRFDAGDVTDVEVLAELPHPAAASATNNSRGARELTADTMHKPRQLGHASTAPASAAWYHLVLQRNTQ